MNKYISGMASALDKLKKRGFFFIFGSSTINKIIGFASSWIIVRIISKPEYGVYTHAYNIYGFILLLNGLGITSAVLQIGSEAKTEEEKRCIYGYGLRVGISIDLILSAVILLIGFFIPLKIDGSNKLLVMMFLLPAFTIVTDLQLMYLRINLKNKQFAETSTINSFAVLILSCLLSYCFKAPGLVLAGYCSHLFTSIIANRVFHVPFRVGAITLSGEDKRSVFSISLISMVNNGLSHLMYLLDIFVIGFLIAESEVIASYKIATNIPTALQFIPTALVLFAYPHFARNKDNKKWVLKNYIRMILPFGVFNLLVSIFLIVLSEPIITIVFGSQYLDAAVPFRILCVSYFFSATFRTVSGALLVTQRQLKFNLFVSIIAAALNSILNFVLINAMQMRGAAIATLITTTVCGLLSTVYFLIFVLRKKEGASC